MTNEKHQLSYALNMKNKIIIQELMEVSTFKTINTDLENSCKLIPSYNGYSYKETIVYLGIVISLHKTEGKKSLKGFVTLPLSAAPQGGTMDMLLTFSVDRCIMASGKRLSLMRASAAYKCPRNLEDAPSLVRVLTRL